MRRPQSCTEEWETENGIRRSRFGKTVLHEDWLTGGTGRGLIGYDRCNLGRVPVFVNAADVELPDVKVVRKASKNETGARSTMLQSVLVLPLPSGNRICELGTEKYTKSSAEAMVKYVRFRIRLHLLRWNGDSGVPYRGTEIRAYRIEDCGTMKRYFDVFLPKFKKVRRSRY
jgi:hypothetical protein